MLARSIAVLCEISFSSATLVILPFAQLNMSGLRVIVTGKGYGCSIVSVPLVWRFVLRALIILSALSQSLTALPLLALRVVHESLVVLRSARASSIGVVIAVKVIERGTVR